MGLGGYPLVSLAEARQVAFDNRKVARSGGDPVVARVRKIVPTLREVVESVIADRRATWRGQSTERTWTTPFEHYVFPRLGDMRVDQVTLDDVVGVLQPVWQGRGSPGYLLRQRLDIAFRRAVLKGYRTDNPAAQALDLLPRVKRLPRHQPSLPYTKIRAAMAALRASDAEDVVKDVLLFIVLNAVRLGEAVKAVWSEIDFDDRVWTLAPERMKGGRVHQVPLSDQALALLHGVRARASSSALIFTFRSSRGRIRSVTGDALIYWLRKLDLRDPQGQLVVTHGFRTTFRVWAAEVAQAPREVSEAALAHVETDRTVAAYARSSLFDLRRDLMQAWADYVVPRSGI